MNTPDEKLCLQWNDFQENTISAFGSLREDWEFADVTLASEDEEQAEAHGVILGAGRRIPLQVQGAWEPRPLLPRVPGARRRRPA